VLIVALTGGIATGKSVVAKVLSQKGCFVQNADLIAHQLLSPGGQVWSQLVDHFGKSILKEDSSVDRQKLAEIIFGNNEERVYLNHLTHPKVLEEVRQTINRLNKTGSHDIYVTEAALVIEAGYHEFYDRIILTHCSPDIQVERLCQRDGITREQALKKIRSQMPDEQKFPLVHYHIDTSGSLAETIEQTEQVYLCLHQDVVLKKLELLN
jgi:dephospho-CoA kinase